MELSRKAIPIMTIACLTHVFSLEACTPIIPDDLVTNSDATRPRPSVSFTQSFGTYAISILRSVTKLCERRASAAAFKVAEEIKPAILPASLAIAAQVAHGNMAGAATLAACDLEIVAEKFIIAFGQESSEEIATEVASVTCNAPKTEEITIPKTTKSD